MCQIGSREGDQRCGMDEAAPLKVEQPPLNHVGSAASMARSAALCSGPGASADVEVSQGDIAREVRHWRTYGTFWPHGGARGGAALSTVGSAAPTVGASQGDTCRQEQLYPLGRCSAPGRRSRAKSVGPLSCRRPPLLVQNEPMSQPTHTTAATTSMDQSPLERALRDAEQRIGDLTQAVTSHEIVGQATGILIATYRIDPQAAWSLLRRLSQQRNIKVARLASAVIAIASGSDNSIDATDPEAAAATRALLLARRSPSPQPAGLTAQDRLLLGTIRDALAAERDQRASRRDDAAEAADEATSPADCPRRRTAAERHAGARDRIQAAEDRNAAAVDRRIAAEDRQAAAEH
jgi:ANTAR domain